MKLKAVQSNAIRKNRINFNCFQTHKCFIIIIFIFQTHKAKRFVFFLIYKIFVV